MHAKLIYDDYRLKRTIRYCSVKPDGYLFKIKSFAKKPKKPTLKKLRKSGIERIVVYKVLTTQSL